MVVSPLEQVVQAQIPALDLSRFTIDQKIAEAVRYQFMQNYNRNRFYSACSSLVGLVSFVGFGFSLYKLFISPAAAVAFAAISFALNRLWVNTRNQEGYALEKAFKAQDDEGSIWELSLGANIYQEVWPCGGAAANLFTLLKGSPRTVMQAFTERGNVKVVAYLAMLEPDLVKQSQMATDALPYARDDKTAQLLLDLGGKIQEAEDQRLWVKEFTKRI